MGLTEETTKARDGRASLGHAGEEAPRGRGRKETMERDLSPRRGPHACQGGVREPRAAPHVIFQVSNVTLCSSCPQRVLC